MTGASDVGASGGRASAPDRDAASIGRVTRALHWGSALLLATAFGLAWTFSALGPGGLSARLVGAHRSVGLSILLLATLRLAWRAVAPLPPLPRATARWDRRAARVVQAALYICLLAMPVLGWFGSGANADTVSFLGVLPLPDLTGPDQDLADRVFLVHQVVGYVILGLTTLHVAGALRHHLVKRDGVLLRMLTGRAADDGARVVGRPAAGPR